MISQTAEYALRTITYLADQDRTPHTTAQIAEATQIPAGYLAKVMQSLSRAPCGPIPAGPEWWFHAEPGTEAIDVAGDHQRRGSHPPVP